MSAIPKIDEAKLDSVSGTPPAIYHVTKIEGGYAPITGFHTGSKDAVMIHASALAREMNARRGVKGTRHIVIGKPKQG